MDCFWIGGMAGEDKKNWVWEMSGRIWGRLAGRADKGIWGDEDGGGGSEEI